MSLNMLLVLIQIYTSITSTSKKRGICSNIYWQKFECMQVLVALNKPIRRQNIFGINSNVYRHITSRYWYSLEFKSVLINQSERLILYWYSFQCIL